MERVPPPPKKKKKKNGKEFELHFEKPFGRSFFHIVSTSPVQHKRSVACIADIMTSSRSGEKKAMARCQGSLAEVKTSACLKLGQLC